MGGEGLGWERARSDWVESESRKVWEAAREAKKEGEVSPLSEDVCKRALSAEY